LEGTTPGIILIADVYAQITQMMKYNLKPTVNIRRTQVTKIHMSILQFLKQK